MHGIGSKDGDRVVEWGGTSADYAMHRPSYPPSFFSKLAALGVGRPGQKILDLGTGTGFLALQFARQGCRVAGVDISAGQIEQARRLAADEGLSARFEVAAAEDLKSLSGPFDYVTAGQSWLYFDRNVVIPLVKKLLAPGGCLVTCHFCWLPRLDAIARESERLVLRHNPDWTAGDWSGRVPAEPAWTRGHFRLIGFFCYDDAIPFTREGWRGRIRACRGVGATMSAADVRRFDEEHDRLLARIAPDEFTVLHRIDAHILEPIREEA